MVVVVVTVGSLLLLHLLLLLLDESSSVGGDALLQGGCGRTVVTVRLLLKLLLHGRVLVHGSRSRIVGVGGGVLSPPMSSSGVRPCRDIVGVVKRARQRAGCESVGGDGNRYDGGWATNRGHKGGWMLSEGQQQTGDCTQDDYYYWYYYYLLVLFIIIIEYY